MSKNIHSINSTCCIAGGGPAGVMLGYLLARAGIDVVVLEKHSDFFRDFRGDTVHPSTLRVIDELGLLDSFLQQPHQKISKVSMDLFGRMITVGDLSSLNIKTPYIAMMPQWNFLNFIVSEAKKISHFKIMMQAECIDLVIDNNQVTGCIVKTPSGLQQINSVLLVGADGRHSTVRKKAELTVHNIGVAIDALWFRLSRKLGDPNEIFANVRPGNLMVMINRDEYWQCAYIIPKGSLQQLHKDGLEQFQNTIKNNQPWLKDRVAELNSWDDVKLLEVQVNRLEKWYRQGLLCIGDAAHAMSPVGGVGINLAIQDAVSASNLISADLKNNKISEKTLQAVQQRRTFPTVMTQRMQILMHKNLIEKTLNQSKNFKLPMIIRLLSTFPFLSKVIGYIMGIGFRPEHIKTNSN